MSLELIQKVWNEAQVSGRPLITLLALATQANGQGELGTTFEDLRHRCRLNRHQLDGCLEQLRVTGHCEIKGPDAQEGRLFITLFPEPSWTHRRA